MPTNANTLINIDIDIKGDKMKDKYVGTMTTISANAVTAGLVIQYLTYIILKVG